MNQIRPFRLRPASIEDADVLSRLIVGAFATHAGRLDPPSGALKDTPESVRTKLATGGAGIAESEGRAVGCVLFTPEDGRVLYVGRLAVATTWRRKGVARALIAYAEAEGRRRGFEILRLRVRIPLVDNQYLFKSCGFAEIARETHEGYSEPTTIRMEKRLPSANPPAPA